VVKPQQPKASQHLVQKPQEQMQLGLPDEKVLQHLRDEFFRRFLFP
jgi:hypothetical protein